MIVCILFRWVLSVVIEAYISIIHIISLGIQIALGKGRLFWCTVGHVLMGLKLASFSVKVMCHVITCGHLFIALVNHLWKYNKHSSHCYHNILLNLP